jgi:hypothetical protein
MFEQSHVERSLMHIPFRIRTRHINCSPPYILITTLRKAACTLIHFPLGSQLEHRAPFGVSVITHTRTIRHTVGLLWTSDQPVTEASTYTGQHNI